MLGLRLGAHFARGEGMKPILANLGGNGCFYIPSGKGYILNTGTQIQHIIGSIYLNIYIGEYRSVDPSN